MTRAEIEAGVHCRGCGLPVIDRLGSWPPLLHMDNEQRAEYEVAQADCRKRHADCRSHRWSVQGSKTTHCGFCCPPPPPSEDQIAKVATLFANFRPKDPGRA